MVECLIQSKPGIPKTTGVDREPQVMGATGDGAPQETAPAEATPTRRPHFRSAPKDGVGRGTLGRGWGRRSASRGQYKDGDKRAGNRSRFCIPPLKPHNSSPNAPKQERPEKFLKTPGSSHQSQC